MIIRILAFGFFIFVFFGCKEKTETGTQRTSSPSSSLVREGDIDLASIDQNKNGQLYQCPMDYNVISDKLEQCPVCKMDLEEYSLEKTRDNLVKNDFKVK